MTTRKRAAVTGRRLAASGGALVLVLLLASLFTFFLVTLLPGDPAVAILGDGQSPERYEEVRQELGLNEPFLDRYVEWLGNAVRGDLGDSLIPPGGKVVDRITAAMPISLELALLAMLVAVVVAIPVALIAANKPGGRFDRWLSAGSAASLSLPSFLVGLLLVLVFVRALNIFPRAEWVRLTSDKGLWEHVRHLVLPVVTIAIGEIAVFSRLLRDDLVRTLDSEFIASARTRGLSPRRVLVRHALRPSSFSFITLAGVNLGRLIGSTVIVESVFTLPGIGTLLTRSASQGDITVVQGVVIVVAALYVIVNAGVDVLYTWLDPRLRRAG